MRIGGLQVGAKPLPSNNAGGRPLLLQRKCGRRSPTPSMTGHCSECGRKRKRGFTKITADWHTALIRDLGRWT
jgi:hypothetical protein